MVSMVNRFINNMQNVFFTEMKINKRAEFWKTVLAGTDLPNNDKGKKKFILIENLTLLVFPVGNFGQPSQTLR